MTEILVIIAMAICGLLAVLAARYADEAKQSAKLTKKLAAEVSETFQNLAELGVLDAAVDRVSEERIAEFMEVDR